jgi:hypothetical protein
MAQLGLSSDALLVLRRKVANVGGRWVFPLLLMVECNSFLSWQIDTAGRRDDETPTVRRSWSNGSTSTSRVLSSTKFIFSFAHPPSVLSSPNLS